MPSVAAVRADLRHDQHLGGDAVMQPKRSELIRRFAMTGVALCAAMLVWTPVSEARVTRIIVDSTTAISGQSAYEQLRGRAFGELDPKDSHNAIITDIDNPLALTNGKAQYFASFVLRKPKDMSLASGVMWHDVPNRGGDVGFPADSYAAFDVQLLSCW